MRSPVSRLLPALTFVALVAASPSAAQSRPPGRIRILGADLSLVAGPAAFRPLDRATRSAFDDLVIQPDVRLWEFDLAKGTHFSWDIAWTRLGEDDEQAQFIAPTAGLRWSLAEPEKFFVPYVAGRVGPYFTKIDGLGGFQTKFGGNAEAGVALDGKVIVAMRYDVLGEARGFDLSGLTARLLIKLY